jgi:hypothetical protein
MLLSHVKLVVCISNSLKINTAAVKNKWCKDVLSALHHCIGSLMSRKSASHENTDLKLKTVVAGVCG